LSLYEEERLVEGRIANATLDGYKIPTIMEAPQVEAILVEEPSKVGPHGAKGVGEPPIILPAAVVVNAVAEATGVRMRDLPLTPDRVLGSLDPML
jgi:CO/xanthine dehydrogenase Mo-binding subunit